MKNKCRLCTLKIGEKIFCHSFAPSMCWMNMSKNKKGYIEMEFGYGDGEDHLFYLPNYCPECGRKNKPPKEEA